MALYLELQGDIASPRVCQLPEALETHTAPGRVGDSGDANCGDYSSFREACASKSVREIDASATDEA